MKAIIALIISFTVMHVSYCQYYYNDIVTTQQTNRQYLALKNNHVKHVSAKSFEANGEPASDFTLEQDLSSNAATITTISEHPSAGKSISTSFYSND
jgi:hypothetical protein